jgi:hypothetical protein
MTTALSVVQKELELRRQSLVEFLSTGSAKTLEEYRAITGELRGLSLAIELIKDLAFKLENQDE